MKNSFLVETHNVNKVHDRSGSQDSDRDIRIPAFKYAHTRSLSQEITLHEEE